MGVLMHLEEAQKRKTKDGVENLIARWESPSGKHWVELYGYPYGGDIAYGYKSNGGGGNIGTTTEAIAMSKMEQKVKSGEFLPDASVKPMVRVK